MTNITMNPGLLVRSTHGILDKKSANQEGWGNAMEPHTGPEIDRAGDTEEMSTPDETTHRIPLRQWIRGHSDNAIFAILIVLALVVVALPHLSFTPATTSNVSTRPELAVFANVSTGTIIFNGTQFTGDFPLSIAPRAGTNTLTLRTPPFNPITCRFDWTGGRVLSGPCTLTVQRENQLNIQVSASDLPVALQAQVQQLTTSTFAQQVPVQQGIVPSGQYYTVNQGSTGSVGSARATMDLAARLSVTPDPQGIIASTVIFPGASPIAGIVVWYIDIPFNFTWQFSQPDGTVVSTSFSGSAMPATLQLTATGVSALNLLSAPNAPTYTLAAFMPQVLCGNVEQQLSLALAAIGQKQQWGQSPHSAPGLAGCQITLLASATYTSGIPPAPSTTSPQFIGRFGVLLAANATAHALLQDVPMASAAEVAAVGA